jgi:shikimate dehydrogenase
MKKQLVAIIGYPVAHSISPAMHNAAFKSLGLNWEYLPFEVKPEDLKKKIDELRSKGFSGFNVTIPHKETIVSLLDETTKLPRMIGAVNTVRVEGQKLVGYNTDAAGFIESLRLDAKFEPKAKRAVILGAGGAAKAAAIMLAKADVASITISDVDNEKAETLADYCDSLFEGDIHSVKAGSPSLREAVSNADLLVNATPIGMHPKEDETPGDERWEMGGGSVLFDLVYNPPETKLMKWAKAKGLTAINGLGMLVRQGALSFNLWTEQDAPVDVMWKAAKEALGLK